MASHHASEQYQGGCHWALLGSVLFNIVIDNLDEGADIYLGNLQVI